MGHNGEGRGQFTFYRSFYDAVSKMKKVADRAAVYDAICEYAIFGKEPDLEKMSDTSQIAYFVIKPILETGRQKARSGKSGGSAKQTASKTEANSKQTEANSKQTEANSKQEQEKDKDKDKDKEQMLYTPLPPSGGQGKGQALDEVLEGHHFAPALEAAIRNWVQHKSERKEPYKPVGLQQLLARVQGAAEQYGDAAVAAMLSQSMAANYQGPVWDWLKNGRVQVANTATGSPKPSNLAREAVQRMMEQMEQEGCKTDGDLSCG